MKVLSINYDLSQPGRNYSLLYNAIKGVSGYWAHPAESFWLIKTSKSVSKVRDELSPYLDQNDKLIVAEFGTWASYNLPKDITDWLHQPVKV